VNRLRTLLVTGLGTGYLPIAPGTWGSAAVVAIYLLLTAVGGGRTWVLSAGMGVIAVAGTVVCVRLGGFAETHFGVKDPSAVTIDEWAGQALSLIAVPACDDWPGRFAVAVTAFLAFRLFDIVKPSPANRAQKLPAGWGIVIDDLIAGIYANVAAQILLRLVLKVG